MAKSDKSRSISQAELHDFEKKLPKLLAEPMFIEGIHSNESYERAHDDHDGTWTGTICVQLSCDGDVWLGSDQFRKTLRFRTFSGGGRSLRVHNALRILALAIKLDNEERPDQLPDYTRPS